MHGKLSSLKKYLNSNVMLNSKSAIDLLISNLTKIINGTAQKSLGIINDKSFEILVEQSINRGLQGIQGDKENIYIQMLVI